MTPRFDIPLPDRMKGLKRDHRGYVVPFFVQWFKDGKAVDDSVIGSEPDFRVIHTQHFIACIRKSLCWICGQPLGTFKCYAVGPMCLINRVTSEPPSHLTCAEYALKVCPFLLNPAMKRNTKDVKEGVWVDGIHNEANPGMMVAYITKKKPSRKEGSDVLIELGTEPWDVQWWKEGRRATYAEAELALVTGYAKLEKVAAKHDKPGWQPDLQKYYQEARFWLPRREA